jgi:lantibiotic modifying enzyme
MISADEIKDGYWSLGSAPPGLYRGLAGTALGLGLAGLSHSRARHSFSRIRDYLQCAVEDYVGLSREHQPQLADTFLGAGHVGPLLSIASIAALEDDRETMRWVSDVGRRLPALAPSAELDYVGGASGLAVALRRLHALSGEHNFARLEAEAIERLIAALPKAVSSQKSPVGLAHGLSGIATAMIGAQGDSPATPTHETALHCLDLEDQLIQTGRADKRGSSWSWCWGATGQLTSRLIGRHESGRYSDLRSAVIAVSTSYQNICHGAIGPVLLMRTPEYRQMFGASDGHAASKRLTRLLLDNPTPRVGAPAFAPDYGLFTGLSGVLAYFASIRDQASFSVHDLTYVPGENG